MKFWICVLAVSWAVEATHGEPQHGTSTGTHSESAPPEQPEPIQSSVSSRVSNVPPSAEARPSEAVS
ncbi:hypothetical protein J4Q44_G00375710 [Coregonus suidteri]|uniref:Secreted mucin n=1 Tax=Coregonus suidteri TaxID=861788 RepID=A0AAN8Q9T6_9TELE